MCFLEFFALQNDMKMVAIWEKVLYQGTAKDWSKFPQLHFHSVVFNLSTLLIFTGLWPVYRRLNFDGVPKSKESVV